MLLLLYYLVRNHALLWVKTHTARTLDISNNAQSILTHTKYSQNTTKWIHLRQIFRLFYIASYCLRETEINEAERRSCRLNISTFCVCRGGILSSKAHYESLFLAANFVWNNWFLKFTKVINLISGVRSLNYCFLLLSEDKIIVQRENSTVMTVNNWNI